MFGLLKLNLSVAEGPAEPEPRRDVARAGRDVSSILPSATDLAGGEPFTIDLLRLLVVS
jgi:hypothetical protein